MKVKLAYELSLQIKQYENFYFQPQRLKVYKTTDKDKLNSDEEKVQPELIELSTADIYHHDSMTSDRNNTNSNTFVNQISNQDSGTTNKIYAELIKTAANNKKMIRNVKLNPFKCKVCHKTLSSISAFKRHIVSRHGAAGRYSCDKCSKQFHEKYHVLQHMIVHKSKPDLTAKKTLSTSTETRAFKFIFKGCSKTFLSSCNVKYHENNHSGRILNSNEALKRHLEAYHSAAERYSCDKCQKQFRQKSQVLRHMMAHKNNANFKPRNILSTSSKTRAFKCAFKCTFKGCSETFPFISNLKRHACVHSGNFVLSI